MRHALLLLLAGCGLAALVTAPAQAVGTRYPFCIQGDEQPGLSNCTFISYEQCAATASGRRLYCIPNPFYAGDSDAPPPGAYGRSLPPPPPPPGYRRY
ncbi:MAG TPA: DUF3551 domain-containing protein [Bradyrhizobium sp.]